MPLRGSMHSYLRAYVASSDYRYVHKDSFSEGYKKFILYKQNIQLISRSANSWLCCVCININSTTYFLRFQVRQNKTYHIPSTNELLLFVTCKSKELLFLTE